MGTTYLELTNRVLRRINEVELDSATFSDCKGVHAAAKDAVLDIVRDINSQKFEWPFNSSEGTQLLVVGQELYTWPTDLRIPDWNSFYIERDTSLNINTTPLKQITKDEWFRYSRKFDFDSDTAGIGVPKFVFEAPNGGFGVTESPSVAYTVKFRYWIKTIDLVTFDDEATVPSEYDYVITDGAINLMYMFLDNDERAQVALASYKRGLSYMSYVLIPKDPYVYDHTIRQSKYSMKKMWNGN